MGEPAMQRQLYAAASGLRRCGPKIGIGGSLAAPPLRIDFERLFLI
jgi:hypothetical protein